MRKRDVRRLLTSKALGIGLSETGKPRQSVRQIGLLGLSRTLRAGTASHGDDSVHCALDAYRSGRKRQSHDRGAHSRPKSWSSGITKSASACAVFRMPGRPKHAVSGAPDHSVTGPTRRPRPAPRPRSAPKRAFPVPAQPAPPKRRLQCLVWRAVYVADAEDQFGALDGKIWSMARMSGPVQARIATYSLSLCMLPLGTHCQAEIRFEAVSSSGMLFALENAPTPSKRPFETLAGGLAVFDYDADGRPDIFFTNGADPDSMRKNAPKFRNRLYRNIGGLRFLDVTARAGVAGEGYSMGAAAGDYDNDGNVDLFVAGVFKNFLYRNRGDGTFEDVTSQAAIDTSDWVVAAGWFDYDGDGLIDLMAIKYADWTLDSDRYCGDRARDLRVYCHPKNFTPTANRLYRNLGNGKFEDVSDQAGLSPFRGRGMSVAFADFDDNGWQDAFVTNDYLPNFLFLNQDGTSFVEDGLLAGVALLDQGKPVASMGVDIGDFDNDGDPDLSVTALNDETFPLFRDEGQGSFRDATAQSGLARASRSYAGWGNVFADFDNDANLDLFTANSHVNPLIEEFETFSYKQPNTVFRNLEGRFEGAQEVGEPGAYRGAAVADFDGDGRLDVVISELGERATLLRNVSEPAGAWFALDLVGSVSNRDALGARVRARDQTRWVKSAAGYASSTLRPIHFGMEESPESVTVEIAWPSGARQTVESVPLNQTTVIHEPR